METEKPFLIPELTLNQLAEKVSIPPRSLSEVINSIFHQNFFDYINSYRIQEAKQLLMNSNDNKTILYILLEVGFNNKSVFNNAFKKHTGMTPTQWKKSIQDKVC